MSFTSDTYFLFQNSTCHCPFSNPPPMKPSCGPLQVIIISSGFLPTPIPQELIQHCPYYILFINTLPKIYCLFIAKLYYNPSDGVNAWNFAMSLFINWWFETTFVAEKNLEMLCYIQYIVKLEILGYTQCILRNRINDHLGRQKTNERQSTWHCHSHITTGQFDWILWWCNKTYSIDEWREVEAIYIVINKVPQKRLCKAFIKAYGIHGNSADSKTSSATGDGRWL